MPTVTKMERFGEINKNKYGSLMKIISYINSNDIIVQFQDENKHETHTTYGRFISKNVKNPYDRSVYNTGYLGEASTRECSNHVKKSYYAWKAMIKRCYTNNYKSYSETYVCEEWHSYENFEKWYDDNYWECGNEKMELDKDILSENNKVYSPSNCIFVPQRINLLFQSAYDIVKNGTSYRNKEKLYKVSIRRTYYDEHNNVINRCVDYIGSCNSKEESISMYLENKRIYIKQIASEYKEKYPTFSDKVYQAMMNY